MRLRDARRRRFYSAHDLGERADINPGTIYAIEAGRELPTLPTARLLAAALDDLPEKQEATLRRSSPRMRCNV